MYSSYRGEVGTNDPPRRRLPGEYRRGHSERRHSDPVYYMGGYRVPEEERETLRDIFAELMEKHRERSRQPPRHRPAQPAPSEPEVPSAELKTKLHVKSINMHVEENTKAHHTEEYDCTEKKRVDGKFQPGELVIRRGQEFTLTIDFDRPYNIKENDATLIFKMGSLKETVKVEEKTPESKKFKKWRSYLVSMQANSLTVSVFIPPDAAVGTWTLIVKTAVEVKNGEPKFWQCVHDRGITVLFNPWCKKDVVYVADEAWLNEAVLNDYGCIYIGNADSIGYNKWFFGQFERGILGECLALLKKAFDGEPSRLMGNAVQVVRGLSAIVNSNDDDGVLMGNWSGDYGKWTNPSDWAGSVNILLEHAKTGKPVRYGQCWVFSGVLTTVCRALGIPCRSVTNFESAHNSDLCHLSSDIINKKGRDGKWYEERTDSIWNFHVWNEVWMSRPDLKMDGKNYDGWQVIDATPQERSDGIFQCGPCPLKAIKEGDLPVGLDTAFVFAEVNGDKVEWTEHPKTKVLYQIEREKDAIGKYISTKKATGEPVVDPEMERLDITNLYKYEEGSRKEREIVRKAERLFRCANFDDDDDEEDEPPPVVDVVLNMEKPEKVKVGESIPIKAVASNMGNKASTISLDMEILYVDYRRRNKGTVCSQNTPDIHLKPGEKTELKYAMSLADVLRYPEFGLVFKVNVVMELKGIDLSKKKSFVIRVEKPELKITGPSGCRLDEVIDVVIQMTNPLGCALTNCSLKLDGGLKLADGKKEIPIGTIRPKETWSKKVAMKPNPVPKYRPWRCCQIILVTKEIGSIYGNHNVRIRQNQS